MRKFFILWKDRRVVTPVTINVDRHPADLFVAKGFDTVEAAFDYLQWRVKTVGNPITDYTIEEVTEPVIHKIKVRTTTEYYIDA